MKQVELVDRDTGATMLCWLDAESWNLKKYDRVELKAIPDVEWVVVNIYTLTASPAELYKPWRVGGLK